MSSVEIKPNVYWVGAVDWNIRTFHGPAYSTPRGTTYNAYLVVDDQITLVDTVYGPFAEDLIRHIGEIIDPSKIDNVIINHIESDHIGAFPEIMKLNPKAKVYATANAEKGIKKLFFTDYNITVVKTGDSINTGKYTFSFIEAPMLHWPDSMFTYISELKLLLPNDAFGQHYASNFRFADEVDLGLVMFEAQKYYANILNPFSRLVLKKLEEVAELGLEIDMIAPSHGFIWRGNPEVIIEAYQRWAQGAAEKKIVIAYDTMWQSTAKLAHALLEGVTDAGYRGILYQISKSDHNDIITNIFDARGVFIGSPTYYNDTLTTVSPLLDELIGLKAEGKFGLAFGSQGWAGGAAKTIEAKLKSAGVELAAPAFTVKWVPTEEELDQARSLARSILS